MQNAQYKTPYTSQIEAITQAEIDIKDAQKQGLYGALVIGTAAVVMSQLAPHIAQDQATMDAIKQTFSVGTAAAGVVYFAPLTEIVRNAKKRVADYCP